MPRAPPMPSILKLTALGGSDPDKVDYNDELDTAWMGKPITLGIEAKGRQVMEDYATQYTVTLDANGGTWDEYGDSAQVIKQLNYGEKYGELPTPTRKGYTFLGWRGKNLFDINATNQVSTGVTKDSEDWITIDTYTGALYYNYYTKNLELKENMQYILILEIKKVTNIDGVFHPASEQFNVAKTQFKDLVVPNKELTANNVIIKNLERYDDVGQNVGLRSFYTNNNYSTNSKITFRISVLEKQEISNTDFIYEPHYINETNVVTQTKDHTLIAIWEKNN